MDGVPVEARVEAVFLPMSPDLPMPITATLPVQKYIFLAALRNPGPSLRPRESTALPSARMAFRAVSSNMASVYVFITWAECCGDAARESFPTVSVVCDTEAAVYAKDIWS